MASYFGINMDQALNSPAFNDFTGRFVLPFWRPLQNFSRTNPTVSYWKTILQGKVGRNSNPLHPAIVHAPVVLLPLALILDWLVFLPGLSWLLGVHHSQFHVFSYYLNLLACIAAIPSAMTGFAEFLDVNVNQQPLWNKVFLHMVLNEVALVTSLLNWWGRRNATNFSPTWGLMLLNLVTLLGVFVSAHIGGNLVYEHGVGVQRQGDGKLQKAADKKEEETPLYPNLTGTGAI